MKILHVAPFNTSGVPGEMMRAERELGHYSRLVTLAKDRREYEEDICLDLPFIDFMGTRFAKRLISAEEKLTVANKSQIPDQIPIEWHPHNIAEALLVKVRDLIWARKIYRSINENHLLDFDVYQLDGGLGFFRNSKVISGLKDLGRKIICCYTGSDLRTRGVIPAIDKISDLNVSLEFDHLQLHPNIHHVFFPFDVTKINVRCAENKGKIKIGHAPTVRKAKGSDVIIAVLSELQMNYDIEPILIENLPHHEALQRKAECDIFIDQIGDLGYGINSLESLAMGIPTCSCLAAGFADKYPDHPFIEINESSLREKLVEVLKDENLRTTKGREGRVWVAKYHNSRNTVKTIHELAGLSD